jgi:7-cyano-7-deazaguanine synthase in queuosine biosynthesis
MNPLEVLEDEYPTRPRMRIRFYKDGHITVSRLQMVCPCHGDVFYLRALLLHRSAQSWADTRTVEGVVYPTHQEAARAMGLFDNRDEGVMAFEELLNLGTAPAQLRWISILLAVEGNPVMSI